MLRYFRVASHGEIMGRACYTLSSDPIDTRTCYSLPLLLHDQPIYLKKDMQMCPVKCLWKCSRAALSKRYVMQDIDVIFYTKILHMQIL